MRTLRLLFLVLGLCAVPAPAADWPQYRGPNRNDISAETGLLSAWPKEGPPLLWTYSNLGVGYSGPAVIGDHLYTTGGRGDSEFLIALDIGKVNDKSVAEAWAVRIGPLFEWKGNSWSAGPSATPTVDGNLIFALGGMGDLLCVNAENGKELWRKDLANELDAQVNPIGGGPKNLGWGYTWSPLVDGDQLVCAPGGPKGTLAALDKKTGKVLWRSTAVTDQATYTSPMLMEVDGVKQYVLLTNQGLTGVAAKDGALLWRYRRPQAYSTEVVNTPLIRGGHVYATVGSGNGCDLVKVERDGDKFKVDKVYANKNMANHHGNVVLVGDHVYGFSEGKGWTCQDFKSGDTTWVEKGKLRAGSVVFADGRLYCYGEDDGTVALIQASIDGWKESGRFKIPQLTRLRKPSGRIWTPPVIAGGRLFLRDQDLLFCFDIKRK
ncbi:MAG: PQQ-like beta-propeller repeat protein [Gemmataceae bacterium]|nr:PQQ-like beta-propeller repeat protein [Gemmataceae bacterium]